MPARNSLPCHPGAKAPAVALEILTENPPVSSAFARHRPFHLAHGWTQVYAKKSSGGTLAPTSPPAPASRPLTVGPMLTPAHTLAMALDPCLILKAQAMQPDPWQRELLLSTDRQTLLMCSRGAGKSRTHQRPGPPHRPLHPQGQGPSRFQGPTSEHGAVPLRQGGLPRHRLAHPADQGDRDAVRVPKREPYYRPSRQGRDHPLPARRDAAHPGRGGPHPRRPVPLREAHARRQPGPPGRAHHALRPARLVLQRVGARQHLLQGENPLEPVPAHQPRLHRRGEGVDGRTVGQPGVRVPLHGVGRTGLPRLRQGRGGYVAAADREARGRHRLRLAEPLRGDMGRAGPRRRAMDRLGALLA